MTGDSHGKSFADIRDHALIRVLTEGLRRTEITEMRMTDLPLDLVSQRLIRVVPLKGARAEEAGRLVLIAPATARAVVARSTWRFSAYRSSIDLSLQPISRIRSPSVRPPSSQWWA